MNASSRSILRDPIFARLWFVQAATQVGGNMALYALTILVFATTRSNTAVSALVMSFLLPTIGLSAFAGVIVDRLDLRWALVVPNVVRSLLTLGLALAGTEVGLLLALNLGVSLTTVALTPAEAAMIPRVVGRAQLETAMGVFNITLQASFAAGFAFLGPVLVAVADPSFVLAVATILYVAATIACLGLPSAPPADRPGGPSQRTIGDAVGELREGLAAIRQNRGISLPLVHLAASASLVGVVGVLGPDLASSIGLDPDQLIVIVLPLGLGVLVGVLGLRRLPDVSRRRAAEAALVVFGLAALAIAVVAPAAASLPAVPIVVGLALIAGAAYAATTVSAQTSLFEHMPAGVRGRIFGVLASIVSAASLVPILVAGPLADSLSAPLVIGFVGGMVIVVSGLSARSVERAGSP